MNLPYKESLVSSAKQSSKKKGTSLNPNAAEFVPFTLSSSNSLISSGRDSKGKLPAPNSQVKQVPDQLESSVSVNSDEEAYQYWQQQLPDDLTPDFKVMGDEDLDGTLGLSLGGLSLHNESELDNHILSSGSSYVSSEGMKLSQHASHALSTGMMYPPSSYGVHPSSSIFVHQETNSWNKPASASDPLVGKMTLMEENRMRSYANNMFVADNYVLENNEMNPLDYLTFHFPGFAAGSLAEVYFANGCDLQMTIEILTQLELQVDGDSNQGSNSKTSSPPNLSSSDFPSLMASNNNSSLSKYSVDQVPQSAGPYMSDKNMTSARTTSFLSRGPVDFASAVRKLASHESGAWKYEGNTLPNCSIGSIRTPNISARSNNIGPSQGICADKLHWHGSSGDAPGWLETGEAVANLYSELRKEASDHARLRNAFFEQARQAYLIGNKALAKELSARGRLHNEQMKAAHSKAQESIYRRRNPVSVEGRGGGGGGSERLIDLHGLHVSEAIHVLKNELSGLRRAARSAEERLQVYICVGTGHHTKGSRTPARLPVAVQRYLLEEEGLQYFEPQPGLLRVVIC